MTTATFVDDICGSGKSVSIMAQMNANPTTKFMYATPVLKEATRIMNGCPELDFSLPKETISEDGTKTSKRRNLLNSLKRGRNISTTHKMLKNLLLTDADYSDYTLILDEVLDLVEQYNGFKGDDLEYLMCEGFIEVDRQTGILSVTDKAKLAPAEYADRIIYMREQCLFLTKQGAVIIQLPTKVLTQFKEVVVMSYMVEGSYLFQTLLQLGVPITKVMVNSSMTGFKPFDSKEASAKAKAAYALINLFVPKLGSNNEYEKVLTECSLSVSSTDRLSTLAASRLAKVVCNTLKRKMGARQSNTLVSSFGNRLEIPSFKRSMVAFNCRATNDYSHTTNLVYLIERHQNQIITQWQKATNNLVVNEDYYSLDCLIQWIFRSAIRNGESIELFLPSKKMRNLLDAWGSGSLF